MEYTRLMDKLQSMINDRPTFNGWKNHATWNVSLWLQNNELMYNIAKKYDRYDALIPRLELNFGQMTPDGVRWMDPSICTAELDEMLAELA